MLILDTNILISYFNGEDKVVKQFLMWRESGTHFFISVITEIEVISLAGLTSEEIDKIQRFLNEFTIIPLDSQLGKMVAEIRRQHRIKLGDSIIIATAKLTNAILITQDTQMIKKAKNLVRVRNIF